MNLLAQSLLVPGTADQLAERGVQFLIGLGGIIFLWFLRNLPKMSSAVREFPAQIGTLRDGLSSLSSKLDTLHNDVRALATSNAVRDATGAELERRVGKLESWRERVTEHRDAEDREK